MVISAKFPNNLAFGPVVMLVGVGAAVVVGSIALEKHLGTFGVRSKGGSSGMNFNMRSMSCGSFGSRCNLL
ncbi:hypothetical protein M758_12G056800 [Ceratodon purpureus]|uniref:Uncharacterized protein n=1 Tax=Ceratodon purpureus TaxID=3225 RepID=A0A8T0G524_CERPU|nr:hypothetical protein KC19_12G054100 [Ceratodon purpureus]KAG0598241.1 hypothetical protein M758_12G056800 [Ceratodon purpureus]